MRKKIRSKAVVTSKHSTTQYALGSINKKLREQGMVLVIEAHSKGGRMVDAYIMPARFYDSRV